MRIMESPTLTAFTRGINRTLGVVSDSGSVSAATNHPSSDKVGNSLQPPTCGRLMGYMMAKSEGRGNDWHGHVTDLSVAPEYRRLGLATQLMEELEETSDRKRCYFVDLFVRASNNLGLEIYTKLGFVVYRRVLNYYWGSTEDEDALDMRKSLSIDVNKECMIPTNRVIHPSELKHP